MFRQIEEDEKELERTVPSGGEIPVSRAYRCLDCFFGNNVLSNNPVNDERQYRKPVVRGDMFRNRLKKSLRDAGFGAQQVENMF